jgi:hypothetical protein
MAAEQLEKRFGITALEKGFVTSGQVMGAMEIQIVEDIVGKEHRRLGEIMVEQRFMKKSQVEEVLQSMNLPM